MLQLNLLNKIPSKDVDLVHSLSKRESIAMLLKILGIKNPLLTSREIDLISFMLATNPEANFFKGKYKQVLMEEFSIKSPNVYYYQSNLERKGVVIDGEISPKMKGLLVWVEKGLDITFKFKSNGK